MLASEGWLCEHVHAYKFVCVYAYTCVCMHGLTVPVWVRTEVHRTS